MNRFRVAATAREHREPSMLDEDHLTRNATLEVQHYLDREHFTWLRLLERRAARVEVGIARVADELERAIRLLHEQPLRVSHGRAVSG